MRRPALTLASLTLVLFACSEPPPAGDARRKPKDAAASQFAREGASEALEPSRGEEPSSTKKKPRPSGKAEKPEKDDDSPADAGGEKLDEPATSSDADTPSVSPPPVSIGPVQLSVIGHGEITSIDDKYDMHKQQEITVDDATITVDTTKVWSSKSRVTEKLQSSLGRTIATRITSDENAALAARKDFAYSSFVFYVKQIERVGKTNVTLSSPVPYFGLPAPYARYQSLPVGQTLTTRATVSGHGEPYEAVFTVTRHPDAGPKTVVVEIAMTIPSDTDGRKYEIGIPHRSTFVIETESRRVTSINVAGFYYSDRAPGNPADKLPGGLPDPRFEMFSKRQPLYLNNCVQSETRKGQTKQYPCG